MEFGELVSYSKEYGKKDADLLVIMPAFSSYENVQGHLECLCRQTFKNFNVLLVLGVPFEDKRLQVALAQKKFPFGIIIAKENERRGCSGGFFAGQKYALEKGYKYAIMADDDCMPTDAGLVENLYANRAKKYVTCRTHFVADGYRKAAHVSGPSQYTLYDVEIFKKYGLYYLPLFHGADDGEYIERVREKSFQVENYCEHPYNLGGKKPFVLFDRSWLFLLQALIIMKSARGLLYNLLQFAFLMGVCLFFLPKYGKKLFGIMNGLLLSHTYGKKAFESIKSGYGEFVCETAALPEGLFEVDEKEAKYIDMGKGGKIASLAKEAVGAFGRQMLVKNTYSYVKVFALCIFAKKLYVELEGGKSLLLASNENGILHAVKIAAFCAFLPLYAVALFALFVPIKIILQPRTIGYGLD